MNRTYYFAAHTAEGLTILQEFEHRPNIDRRPEDEFKRVCIEWLSNLKGHRVLACKEISPMQYETIMGQLREVFTSEG